jgi:hypothetical protein
MTDLNWLFLLTSIPAIAGVSCMIYMQPRLWSYMDQLRQEGQLVLMMMIGCGQLLMLAYAVTWLMIILDHAGLPMSEGIEWLFDLFILSRLNG